MNEVKVGEENLEKNKLKEIIFNFQKDYYNSYTNILGTIGEELVKIELSKLKKEYESYNNIIIWDECNERKICQIDHLVISKYGLFIIETKNLQGQLELDGEYWLQKKKNSDRTTSFENPEIQNEFHLEKMEEILRNKLKRKKNIKDILFSVVTVNESADISKILASKNDRKGSENYIVCNVNKLKTVIEESKDVLLTEEEILIIKNLLQNQKEIETENVFNKNLVIKINVEESKINNLYNNKFVKIVQNKVFSYNSNKVNQSCKAYWEEIGEINTPFPNTIFAKLQRIENEIIVAPIYFNGFTLQIDIDIIDNDYIKQLYSGMDISIDKQDVYFNGTKIGTIKYKLPYKEKNILFTTLEVNDDMIKLVYFVKDEDEYKITID